MAADPITTSTIDDIFNEAFSETDDPFADKPTAALNSTRDDKAILSPRKRKDDNENPFADLGLNDEVKVKKARIPNPKLDEKLLLSAPGIPKLRALAKKGVAKKLRFKGKGNEFTDVGRLLDYYQLWLDDLFPRVKFAGGLKMVEKVGHSKRMAVVRKEWIDEGKPGYVSLEMMQRQVEEAAREREQEEAVEKREVERRNGNKGDGEMFFPSPSRGAQKKTEDGGEEPDEDDLDALLAEQSQAAARKETKASESGEDDDLDALLAEQDSSRRPPTTNRQAVSDEDFDDEDALDALLSKQELRKEVQLTTGRSALDDDMELPVEAQEADVTLSSSPLPNNPEKEDLDALLASQEARDEAGKHEQDGSQAQANESREQDDDFFGSPIPNDEVF